MRERGEERGEGGRRREKEVERVEKERAMGMEGE